MAKYMGREMTRRELLGSAGNISQLVCARRYELLDGRGDGVKAVEVDTGGGLEFTLLQDKCLDIYDVRYKGVNLGFISKPGISAPQYFNPQGEFPYYFQSGLLATCGLRNVGSGGEDEGERLPVHGRIGSASAENVSVSAEWEGDEYVLEVSGEMREAALFGESIRLRRRVAARLGGNSIKVTDRVENETCRGEPLMLLYHINFGFPFLGPELRLLLPKGTAARPRDAAAAAGMGACRAFTAPEDFYQEQVFYHDMPDLPGGQACALLRNDGLGLAVAIRYDVSALPFLTQWKSMASGDYALGIEPGTCHVEGRAKERREGTLKTLEPFGAFETGFELTVLEGAETERFMKNYGIEME